MGKTVMMFGVGDLGGWVMEFLARREVEPAIVETRTKEGKAVRD
ncbi:hypothetical protein ES703_111476 [subsurface metagenome]